MFEQPGTNKEASKVQGDEAENVIPIKPTEEPGIIARDSLGNPVGTAANEAEARQMQQQANIDSREAA